MAGRFPGRGGERRDARRSALAATSVFGAYHAEFRRGTAESDGHRTGPQASMLRRPTAVIPDVSKDFSRTEGSLSIDNLPQRDHGPDRRPRSDSGSSRHRPGTQKGSLSQAALNASSGSALVPISLGRFQTELPSSGPSHWPSWHLRGANEYPPSTRRHSRELSVGSVILAALSAARQSESDE